MSELVLENVSYAYKGSDRKAVNNVSVHFEESKVNAVIGPSGSGKTTLLSIMAGLDSPTEGDALIDGERLSGMDLDQYRREKVSMIFQAFHLFPLLTVIENVCFPMELNGVEKEAAIERAKIYLQSVGITEEKHKRYPGNLSGGEQQRVAIARTLASGARVILADEPTSNLDKANGQNIVDILKSLAHDQGYCVIIVTHDPAVAEQADHVWKMDDGVLRAE
ncbi:MAG: ABC transporter ATP-binding protein [Chloroflexi bacterium]|nr:ABC transporter ATP-binding protein [Chloroflexota bacterium]